MSQGPKKRRAAIVDSDVEQSDDEGLSQKRGKKGGMALSQSQAASQSQRVEMDPQDEKRLVNDVMRHILFLHTSKRPFKQTNMKDIVAERANAPKSGLLLEKARESFKVSSSPTILLFVLL